MSEYSSKEHAVMRSADLYIGPQPTEFEFRNALRSARAALLKLERQLGSVGSPRPSNSDLTQSRAALEPILRYLSRLVGSYQQTLWPYPPILFFKRDKRAKRRLNESVRNWVAVCKREHAFLDPAARVDRADLLALVTQTNGVFREVIAAHKHVPTYPRLPKSIVDSGIFPFLWNLPEDHRIRRKADLTFRLRSAFEVHLRSVRPLLALIHSQLAGSESAGFADRRVLPANDHEVRSKGPIRPSSRKP